MVENIKPRGIDASLVRMVLCPLAMSLFICWPLFNGLHLGDRFPNFRFVLIVLVALVSRCVLAPLVCYILV